MIKLIGFSLVFAPIVLLSIFGPSDLWVFVFASGFVALYIDTINEIKKENR